MVVRLLHTKYLSVFTDTKVNFVIMPYEHGTLFALETAIRRQRTAKY
jgi:hypothetical protein